MKFVSWKDKKKFAADLKSVYTADTREAAWNALMAFEEKWGEKYPFSIKSWKDNWESLTTYKEVEGMKVSITKDKILETIKRCEISETGHSEINGLCFEISWHKSKNTKKEKEKIIKAVEHALKIYTANQHLIDPGIKHIVVRAIIKWLYPDAWIDPKIVTPYNVKQRLTIDDKNSYPLDGIYPKFPNKITLWFGYNDKFSITLEFPTLRKMLETLQDIYASQTPVNNLVEIETKKFSDDWLVEKGYNSVTLFRITQK